MTRTRPETAALAAIGVCAVMFVLASGAMFIDERMLKGADIWSKPAKFAFSFGVHIATLLVFARLLSDEARKGRLAAAALLAVSLGSLLEVLYVALQSARGRASHFNAETAWESFMYYQVMGGAALAIVAATALLGFLVLRQADAAVRRGLRLGAGWGAIVSSAATLVVAGAMATGEISGPDPLVGETGTIGSTLPLVGWSREAGDLRVAHFIATHLIQAMPLAGWLADRFLRRGARPGSATAVAAVAIVGLALTAATFAQALHGQPLWPVAATSAASLR